MIDFAAWQRFWDECVAIFWWVVLVAGIIALTAWALGVSERLPPRTKGTK